MLTNNNELLGQALGTCTLKRLIGRGGMGGVYLAQQSRPRRTVAVKVLLPHLIDARQREEFLARFRREADAIAALDHINIMPIYEYGEQGDAAYLVMPYVTGGTLRDRLEAQPILPIQDVVSIIEQVAAGLVSAHALGIIHRDLKPGNILFHADGRVLIADFGLAKMLKDATEADSGAHALTSTGSIMGTPEYLSPEQGSGNPTDYHTDVYSLGIVLYQMLAGRVPFVGGTAVGVAIKHLIEEPPPITQFNPAIPHSVQAVVMKALAKAPEERFASADELAHALHLALSNENATPTWKAPDTSTPSATTIPTTDSPQHLEPAQELSEQADQRAENAKIASVDNRDINNHNMGNNGPLILEAKHLAQRPEQETRQESNSTLPTLTAIPDADELHTSPTEAAPPLHTQAEAIPSLPTVITPREATRENKLEPKAFYQAGELTAPRPETEQSQDSPAFPGDSLGKMSQHQPAGLHTPVAPLQHSRTRLQPIWMMLIGGFLALLIIVAGLAAYTQSQSTSSTSGKGASVTSQATTTPSSQQPPATPAPPVAIAPQISAGTQLYGTPHPFSACDKQGGHWTNPSDASVICNPDGSGKMVNTSQHLATANLDKLLPGNQSPWPGQSFLAQVQVNLNPNSHSAFGIDFQPADKSQGYFAFMLDPSGHWAFNSYNASNGVIPSPLPSGQLSSAISTTLTIDVRVEGTQYAFYVNGVDTSGRADLGSQFINKIAGLAVDTNADVTFSNFAIYAPS